MKIQILFSLFLVSILVVSCDVEKLKEEDLVVLNNPNDIPLDNDPTTIDPISVSVPVTAVINGEQVNFSTFLNDNIASNISFNENKIIMFTASDGLLFDSKYVITIFILREDLKKGKYNFNTESYRNKETSIDIIDSSNDAEDLVVESPIEGVITIEEIDVTDRIIEGSFEFTAGELENGEVLQEPTHIIKEGRFRLTYKEEDPI